MGLTKIYKFNHCGQRRIQITILFGAIIFPCVVCNDQTLVRASQESGYRPSYSNSVNFPEDSKIEKYHEYPNDHFQRYVFGPNKRLDQNNNDGYMDETKYEKDINEVNVKYEKMVDKSERMEEKRIPNFKIAPKIPKIVNAEDDVNIKHKKKVVKKELSQRNRQNPKMEKGKGISCNTISCPPFQRCKRPLEGYNNYKIATYDMKGSSNCYCDDSIDLIQENHRCLAINNIGMDIDERICMSGEKMQPNICAYYMEICRNKNYSLTIVPLWRCLENQGNFHKTWKYIPKKNTMGNQKDFQRKFNGNSVTELSKMSDPYEDSYKHHNDMFVPDKTTNTDASFKESTNEWQNNLEDLGYDKVMAFIANDNRKKLVRSMEKDILPFSEINLTSSTGKSVKIKSALPVSKLDEISNNIIKTNMDHVKAIITAKKIKEKPMKEKSNEMSYEYFKRWLKDHFRREFIDNNDPFAKDDIYLINLIFGSWDTNRDNFLTINEIAHSKIREREFRKIALQNYAWPRIRQHLETFMVYGDINKDGRIDLREFYLLLGNNKSASKSEKFKIQGPTINIYKVVTGASLNLKCNLQAVYPSSIIWKRYDKILKEMDYENEGFQLPMDASLFFPKILLRHTGNYSCQLAESNQVHQIFPIRVLKPPKIYVQPSPVQIIKLPKNTDKNVGKLNYEQPRAVIRCRGIGVPQDFKTYWFKNRNLIFDNGQMTMMNQESFGNKTLESEHLKQDDKSILKFYENGSKLEISGVNYLDNGAYTCQITNEAGQDEAHTDLYILEENEETLSSAELNTVKINKDEPKLYVFDSLGVKVFEPQTCKLLDTIKGNSKITILNYYNTNEEMGKFDSSDPRSPLKNTNIFPENVNFKRYYACIFQSRYCLWGKVVNVENKYIYALQPESSRVVILDLNSKIFREELMTDPNPVDIRYLPGLDVVLVISEILNEARPSPRSVEEIYADSYISEKNKEYLTKESRNNNLRVVKTLSVENISKEQTPKLKSFQIIRWASKEQIHNIVHTQPVNGHFDEVTDIFMADKLEDSDPNSAINFVYTTHRHKMLLSKLDLKQLIYVSSIDLNPYGCYPDKISFYPYGGIIIVRCLNNLGYDKGQLIIDCVTDSIINYDEHIHGLPLVSPDQTYIATIDDRTRIVRVQELNQIAKPRYLFDFIVPFQPDVIDFISSPGTGFSYDLLFASNEQNGIVVFNRLNHTNFDVITGYDLVRKKGAASTLNLQDSALITIKRPKTDVEIKSSQFFGQYIAVTSSSPWPKIYLVNGESRNVHCEIDDISFFSPQYSTTPTNDLGAKQVKYERKIQVEWIL